MSTPTDRLCPDCGEPLGPRTATRHRGCSTAPVSRETATVDDVRPNPAGPVLGTVVGVALLGAAGAASIATGGDYPLWATGGQAAVALTAWSLQHARTQRWRERQEDRRVWERLRRVAGSGSSLVTVHRREDSTPLDLTLHVGPDFDGSDEHVARLREAFAVAIGQHPVEVLARPVRGAWRVTYDPDQTTAGLVVSPGKLSDEDRAAIEAKFTSEAAMGPVILAPDNFTITRQPINVESVTLRVTEALRAALEDGDATLTVRDWSGSTPTQLRLDYPPRVAPKAEVKRADLLATIEAIHPAPTGQTWFVTWQGDRDRYLFALQPDPLDAHVPTPPVEHAPDLIRGATIGITDRGDPWRIPLMGGAHTLVGGATGSGKGSILWGVVVGLAPLIADGRCRLWIADPKGGVEFDRAEGFAHRLAVSPDETADMLEEAAAAMHGKLRALRAQGLRRVEYPTPDVPLDLVIIDEIASAVGQAATAEAAKKATPALTQLLTMGRAPASTVIAAVQDPRKENLRLRGLFTNAVALRLSEPGEVDLLLGRGVRSRGALADLIPERLPGTAFVVQDGVAGAIRARAAHVTDEQIAALAVRLSAPAAGEEVVEVMQADRKEPVALLLSDGEGGWVQGPPAPQSFATFAQVEEFDWRTATVLDLDGQPDPCYFRWTTEKRKAQFVAAEWISEHRVNIVYLYEGSPTTEEREVDPDLPVLLRIPVSGSTVPDSAAD